MRLFNTGIILALILCTIIFFSQSLSAKEKNKEGSTKKNEVTATNNPTEEEVEEPITVTSLLEDAQAHIDAARPLKSSIRFDGLYQTESETRSQTLWYGKIWLKDNKQKIKRKKPFKSFEIINDSGLHFINIKKETLQSFELPETLVIRRLPDLETLYDFELIEDEDNYKLKGTIQDSSSTLSEKLTLFIENDTHLLKKKKYQDVNFVDTKEVYKYKEEDGVYIPKKHKILKGDTGTQMVFMEPKTKNLSDEEFDEQMVLAEVEQQGEEDENEN